MDSILLDNRTHCRKLGRSFSPARESLETVSHSPLQDTTIVASAQVCSILALQRFYGVLFAKLPLRTKYAGLSYCGATVRSRSLGPGGGPFPAADTFLQRWI